MIHSNFNNSVKFYHLNYIRINFQYEMKQLIKCYTQNI